MIISLPGLVGRGAEEVEDGAVYLSLPLFGGMMAEVEQDAVVEDDVLGCTSLYGVVGALAALNVGTEQIHADVHLATGAVDEGTQEGKF